jgi:hypothetical protein
MQQKYNYQQILLKNYSNAKYNINLVIRLLNKLLNR